MNEKENLEVNEEKEQTPDHELIMADYNRLKAMADKKGVSVEEFLNSIERSDLELRRAELSKSCSDPELIEYIIQLETPPAKDELSGIDEVKLIFPEVRDFKDIPPEVIRAAGLRGTTLLSEYVKFRVDRCTKIAEQEFERSRAAKNSVGSQKSAADDVDPYSTEFIRALWGR